MPKSIWACATAAIALAASCASAQTLRTVRPQGPGAAPPWDGAVTTLQAALAAAQPGDEVWVAAGNYTPTNQTLGFAIPKGVKLYGGFAGTEQLPSDRAADVSLNRTILNGTSSVNHIVTIMGASAPVLIDRVTIQNQPLRNSTDSTAARGGGIFATTSTLALVDCTIQNNNSGRLFGGPFSYTVTGDHGGGAYLASCKAYFVRCVFAGNHAVDGMSLGCVSGSGQQPGSGGSGGAIYVFLGSAKFSDCLFIGNSSGNGGAGPNCSFGNVGSDGGSGGAICSASAALAFTRCRFESNVTGSGGPGASGSCFPLANGKPGNGGAVSLASSTLEAESCTFRLNRCGDGAGGICTHDGSAGGSGGALYVASSSTCRIANCLFIQNRSGDGGPGGSSTTPTYAGGAGGQGGAVLAEGFASIGNSTFFQNSVGVGGSGTPSGSAGVGAAIAGSAASVVNSILKNNGATSYAPAVSLSHCCVDAQPPGPNGTNADPRFINADGGNFRLQPFSPCINAANPLLYAGDAVDLDAKPRFVSACATEVIATDPRIGLDMGAYEFQFASPDCDADGICDTRQVTGASVLVPTAPQTGQLFGWSVAISPSFAAVGSRTKTTAQGSGAGEVVAYDRIGAALVSPTSVAPSDAAAGDDFGNQVVLAQAGATEPGWLVVGARFADVAGTPPAPVVPDAGAAYAFRRTGNSWTFAQKLTSAAPAPNGQFAHGLAIDAASATLVAGSLHAGTPAVADSGAATVFTLTGNTWSPQATLAASDAASGDGFGISVGVSGNTLVAGAPYRQDNGPSSGAAYVFTRSGSAWSQTAKLVPSDGRPGDTFGELVALSGDTILVSSPRHRVLSRDRAGAVYVFGRSTPGGPWLQTAKLTSDQPRSEELFGFALAIDGDAAVIGGFRRSSNLASAGAAYVFRRFGGTSGSWVRASRIDNPEPAATAHFGYGVALSGSSFLVGAPHQPVAATPAVGSVRAFNLASLDADRSGTIDSCDIAAGLAIDADTNGIPDAIQSTRCATDANADGVLSPADILAFLNDWFPGFANADFNGNGQVEIQDIFDFLNAWFSGC